MELIAIYREARNEGMKHLISDYKSKEDFARDIRAHGWPCIVVLNRDDIERIKNERWTFKEYEEFVKQVL